MHGETVKIIIYNLILQYYNRNKFWPSLGHRWGVHINYVYRIYNLCH